MSLSAPRQPTISLSSAKWVQLWRACITSSIRAASCSVTTSRKYRWWFGEELKRKKAMIRVVDGNKRLAGYVYGRLEGKDWAELLDNHAALVDIYVRPDERMHGIGTALINSFFDWAKEKQAPRIVLSTATQNKAAQALFAKAGFRQTMIEMTRDIP
jgi:ribosomal protein S18 acetylase RimI-like enzyme